MRGNDIRRSFLEFFGERGHKIFPSASLVPDDPTLLLTVAGMVPFKPYFTGEKKMDPPRAASVQKCARTNDIDNVGVTARHQTLFEMLGNFSFGDYFKREAIEWAWELSTDVWSLEPDRIWVTVFHDDDEAARIWHEIVGLPEERIVRRGAEDNFWSIAGVRGPGGPNTELFYDRSPEPMREFDDGDALMEFYNLVFTEFDVGADGEPIAPLASKNVDTGSGLERVAQILQEVPTAYETDLFKPIMDRAVDVTGRAYGRDPAADVSIRILAEHARSAMFLIGDGVLPSNEGRGYVLRRLIRRAVRHARILAVDEPVMQPLIAAAIDVMGGWYPEVATGRSFIEQVAGAEEEHFRGTIGRGMTMLESEIGSAARGSKLSGATAFKLHDTYGFPFELTLEIARDAGLEIDRAGFESLMDEQRERARSARKIDGRDEDALREILTASGPSTFVGYDRIAEEAKVAGIVAAGVPVGVAREGDDVEVILTATPFYPEGGGQIGDAGRIEIDEGVIEVTDTQRRLGDLIVHVGTVSRGEISVGGPAIATVDAVRRSATQRAHSATHILHATLRSALGDHARQAGSLVEPGRLRFDFPHFERVSRAVLEEVEGLVNERLGRDDIVRPYETSMDEARARGAIMLFEEKYGDIVRVVEIGDYSVELCGGIHVTHTSQIGAVKILGEASIGSNLRRIEALTGDEAIGVWRRSRALLEHVAMLLRVAPDEAPTRVEKLLADLKIVEQQRRKASAGGMAEQAGSLLERVDVVGGVSTLAMSAEGLAASELQALATMLRDKLGTAGAVVLASSHEGKATIVAALTKDLAGRVKAQELIGEAARAIGGGAGGRPDFATGGGGKPEGIEEALRIARAKIQELLA